MSDPPITTIASGPLRLGADAVREARRASQERRDAVERGEHRRARSAQELVERVEFTFRQPFLRRCVQAGCWPGPTAM